MVAEFFNHRFEMVGSSYLDLKLQPCPKENASFMRVVLQKVEITAGERTIARTMQADLRLPEDAIPEDDDFATAASAEHAPQDAELRPTSRPAAPTRHGQALTALAD